MDLILNRPGTKCKIGGTIDGLITAVVIDSNIQVQYKIVWWNGRQRKAEWFDPIEITIDNEPKIKIGFE
jgi:hypothetical protein